MFDDALPKKSRTYRNPILALARFGGVLLFLAGGAMACSDDALLEGCSGSADCAPGSTCVDRVCAKICSIDDDCPGNLRCSENRVCTERCEGVTQCTRVPGNAACFAAACRDQRCVYDVLEGEACGAEACVEDTFFASATCDASGACTESSGVSCNGYTCKNDGLACSQTCVPGACAGGFECVGTACLVSNGGACVTAPECASGFCAGTVCCAQACDLPCQRCGGGGVCAYQPCPARGPDFNADGNVDMAYQQPISGTIQIRLSPQATSELRTIAGDPGWQMVAAADFNDDQRADLVMQRTGGVNESVQVEFWVLDIDQSAVLQRVPLGGVQLPFPPWEVVGSGDFIGDSKSDILWHNPTSRQAALWSVQNFNLAGSAFVAASDGAQVLLPAPWVLVGTSDFDQDGTNDLLWRNPTSRATRVWFMNGAVQESEEVIAAAATVPSPPWTLAGAWFFGSENSARLIWYISDSTNTSYGLVTSWLMNGVTFPGPAQVLRPTNEFPEWVPVAP